MLARLGKKFGFYVFMGTLRRLEAFIPGRLFRSNAFLFFLWKGNKQKRIHKVYLNKPGVSWL